MREQDKIAEADHFLARMNQSPEAPSFRYELSAFLSASRSALQYALEEAKTKPGSGSTLPMCVAAITLPPTLLQFSSE